jgi:hypothetical protein
LHITSAPGRRPVTIAAMTSLRLGLCAIAAALAGCGGEIGGYSAREGCLEVWASVCARYYVCFSPGQLEEGGLPPTEAECAVQLGNQNCSEWTADNCNDGLIYHPPAVPDCQAEIEALGCDVVEGGPSAAPACALVCTASQ